MSELPNTYLSNAKQLGGVAQAPVAELVAQHSNNLLRFSLLDQGIIDDNVLLPWQAVEVGIAVGTALAAVNDVQLLEGEVKLLSEVLDTGLQCTRLEGRELVEQRQNDDGVDSDGEDLEEDSKEPQVVEERVIKLLHDLEHSTDDGSTENNSKHLSLEHIRDPKLEGLLVEAKLLLEHKSVVVGDRQRENSA